MTARNGPPVTAVVVSSGRNQRGTERWVQLIRERSERILGQNDDDGRDFFRDQRERLVYAETEVNNLALLKGRKVLDIKSGLTNEADEIQDEEGKQWKAFVHEKTRDIVLTKTTYQTSNLVGDTSFHRNVATGDMFANANPDDKHECLTRVTLFSHLVAEALGDERYPVHKAVLYLLSKAHKTRNPNLCDVAVGAAAKIVLQQARAGTHAFSPFGPFQSRFAEMVDACLVGYLLRTEILGGKPEASKATSRLEREVLGALNV